MRLGREIGIDLGTANTRIWAGGRVVLNEPTVIAVDHADGAVLAVGKTARDMIGRAPERIDLIRPVKDGCLDNYEMAGHLLQHFFGGPSRWRALLKPRVVVGLPSQVTKVQMMAAQDSLLRAGAGQVRFVSGVIASAVGAGIDPNVPGGWLLVDLGGGAVDIAVISLGGVVLEKYLRLGGLALDEAIATFVRRRFNVSFGERTAEKAKISLGSAWPEDEEVREFRGVNHATGLPIGLPISNQDVYAAIREGVTAIVTGVKQVLEETPPELSSDVMSNGIILTGCGSQLASLDRLLANETGLPIRRVENPGECQVRGIGRIIGEAELRKRIAPRRVA